MDILRQVEAEYLKKDVAEFAVGDTVEVHVLIKEGEKERVTIFTGTVIKKKGSGSRELFTVRKIVQGQGVERSFPLNSPSIVNIVVTRRGKVRRAKLYYLRDRVGKATKVKEKKAAYGGKAGSSKRKSRTARRNAAAEKND